MFALYTLLCKDRATCPLLGWFDTYEDARDYAFDECGFESWDEFFIDDTSVRR